MQLSVMVAYSLRVVASIARYGQWVLANAACIIGVAFRNTMLLTQVLGYVAISLLYRNSGNFNFVVVGGKRFGIGNQNFMLIVCRIIGFEPGTFFFDL